MSLHQLQDAKEQVRQATDIVDLVGSYLSLRRLGRNFVGLCPWHDDSRPSMQVNPERQSFKCWVCDIGGDVFSFLMRIEGLEFREALEMLADRAGIILAKPHQASSGASSGDSQFDRRNLLAAMAWAEEQFHRCLLTAPEAETARQYLADRGLTDDSVRAFHLGFSPDQWDWLLGQSANSSFSPEVLERVGLVLRRSAGGFYDRFRGRLLFSIRDARSRPIAFGGRILPGHIPSDPERTEAKYINSPESPLFSKSSELYALDLAREAIAKEHGLVVMEGYTDVIMAHQHGIRNAVAVLGTALGEKHLPIIKRFTDSITLVLDGDEAGQRRTMQILDELLALFVAHEIDLKILSLPTGADPCDVISSQGSEAFRERLTQSLDPLDYKIAAVTNGLESAPGTHRVSLAVEELLGTLARAMPTSARTSSSNLVREQQVLARLARRFGIGEETLRVRLTFLRREQRSRPARRGHDALPIETRPTPVEPWQRELLELLIHEPSILPHLADHLAEDGIGHTHCRAVYAAALQLMHDGQIPTFDQLMLACDDPAVKSLLVDCDELGREKLTSDPQRRLQDLLQLIGNQQQALRHQTRLAELNQPGLDPQHEQEVLAELFNDLKRRQAGSTPTDG